MARLTPGKKVRYLPQPEWGVGHLLELFEDDTRARILFSGRDEPVIVSTRGGTLVPHVLSVGERVRVEGGLVARITEVIDVGEPLSLLRWEIDEDESGECWEDEVLPLPPRTDMESSLAEGRVGGASPFLLRRDALRLDDERRNDALGALLASRVMVRPHQVGVVQRVLSAPRPRFVLADEVGLGKTIESGMIFSALRLAGLVKRVLVVAPSHLTVQWLVELYHKFNQLFTMMDTARYNAERELEPDQSPWSRFELVVTSLELLSRHESYRDEVSHPSARWDLVIMDEAHHLKSERAYEVAEGLAKNSWGLLLLTATPMQLDPDEYYALLRLVDPDAAPSAEIFSERLAAQEKVSGVVRALLEDGEVEVAREALLKIFPRDPVLPDLEEEHALLAHVAETYSLSERLIRNRRATVGGFAERRLRRHEVSPSDRERALRDEAIDRLRESAQVRGAVLAGLLKRIESSPEAFREAARASDLLESLASQIPDTSAKLQRFLEVMAQINAAEPGAKVLVFTESRATLDWLIRRLGEKGIASLGYHGGMEMVERDRCVARFRDPEGPRVLISTEVGGEGRNFQFCHHLVNFDLPWSPAAMEQRIGRLDRIGQTSPVDIHVFDAPGTFSSEVLTLLADAVGVFDDTVGGLDAVLEEVEPELARLALEPLDTRWAYGAALGKRVEEARAQVRRAYDPLLDLRSFDQAAVEAVTERAIRRLGLHEDLDSPDLDDALWGVARDLDERLEEEVTELATRVGIAVDTDEQVEAFECAFHFGQALQVDALPGIDIREERTVHGTFWRETAVEREEIDYFATGHPVVESLFSFLRDGPFGRTGARRIPVKGTTEPRRGVEFLFHLEPPEPEDTAPGPRVPSRHLARFMDGSLLRVVVEADRAGAPTLCADLEEALERRGRSLRGDALLSAFPGLRAFAPAAMRLAKEAAEAALVERIQAVSETIEAEMDRVLDHLELTLLYRRTPIEQIARRVAMRQAHYEAILEALANMSARLDSACIFVVS